MNDTPSLRISDLAEHAGTTPPTVRYYESVGLLPRAARQVGGQRRYGANDVRRLLFIRRCRDFGFSVQQVRTLVDLMENPARDCADVLRIASAHLRTVRTRIAELRALERDMTAFAARCANSCAGGPGPSCVPLVQLGDAATGPRAARTTRVVVGSRGKARAARGDRASGASGRR